MIKRMKHEKHGWMHAYDPHEEARLKKLGWIDDVEDVEELKIEPAKFKPEVDVKRGPGRPKGK